MISFLIVLSIFKSSFEKINLENSFKNFVTSELNRLTKDTYDTIKDNLIDILKQNEESQQVLFLDIILSKAFIEKSVTTLYASLCCDIYINLKKASNTGFITILRTKAFEIFVTQDKTILIPKRSFEDDEEYLLRLKNTICGNIVFIAELINQCIFDIESITELTNYLISLSEKYSEFEFPAIEGILVLVDRIASFIHSQEYLTTIKIYELMDNLVSTSYSKLIEIFNTKKLPTYLKFKIINLMEKKKNKWNLTLVDKSFQVKSLAEVNEDSNMLSTIRNESISFSVSELSDTNNNFSIHKSSLVDPFESSCVLSKISINDSGTTATNSSKYKDDYDLETIKDLVLKVMKEYKIQKEERSWSDIQMLLCKNVKYGLTDAIGIVIDSINDFITREEEVNLFISFIQDLISNSNKSITQNDKRGIKKVVYKFLQTIGDLSLDNPYLNGFCSKFLTLVLEQRFIKIKDLEYLSKCEGEELEGIYKILAKTDFFKKSLENRAELINNSIAKKDSHLFLKYFQEIM